MGELIKEVDIRRGQPDQPIVVHCRQARSHSPSSLSLLPFPAFYFHFFPPFFSFCVLIFALLFFIFVVLELEELEPS
jgi:hypothetical protein